MGEGLNQAQLRQERLARLRKVLAKADCAGAVFFDPINIRYASDLSNMQVWCLHNPARYLFVATEGPVIAFEFPTCDHLAERIDVIDEVRPATSWVYLMTGPGAATAAQAWGAEMAEVLTEIGAPRGRLAVDRLEWQGYLALAGHGVSIIDSQSLVEQARMIKTPSEILAMTDAMAACDQAIAVMRAHLEPGITEQALWSVLHRENIASGGEWIETRLLASGPRTNPWYQECSGRVIQAGELVAFDTDLIGRHGICCDISRTWLCEAGKPSDRQRRTYALAHQHLERLRALIAPGVTLREIAEKIAAPPAGYHVYSCLLHGVGLCDEYPVGFWAGQKGAYDATLEPGMTLCLESYLGPEDGPRTGSEGVKLEDQVLVTEEAVVTLSSTGFEAGWL